MRSPIPASPAKVSGSPPSTTPEPRELGQPTRDQRRLGVVAVAQTIGDAGPDREHVLERSGHLTADDVGVGVDAQCRREEHSLQLFGDAGVRDRDDRRGRLARRDLAREVRPGQHADVTGIVIGEHLGDHLRHAQQRPLLDSLDEAHDRRTGPHVRPGFGQHRA